MNSCEFYDTKIYISFNIFTSVDKIFIKNNLMFGDYK